MKKFNNEMKTGLTIAAAILVGLFFWIKTSNFTSGTYRLKAYFGEADGIKKNAIVTLAGIEAGRVEDIEFMYASGETKVGIVLSLDKKARVREDSIAFIGTTGVIGDAYIGITPGSSERFLGAGATVTSEDPVAMRELMKRADEISKNLDCILSDVKTIVSVNKEKVNSIVTNLEGTSANFKDLSADLKAHPWKLLFKTKEKKPKKKKK